MNDFLAWLDRSIADTQSAIDALKASHRGDEADLTKVKLNILNVCKTVHQAFVRAGKDNADYLAKLDALRDGWQISLRQANAHGDVKTAVVEAIKLDTLERVRARFPAQEDAK